MNNSSCLDSPSSSPPSSPGSPLIGHISSTRHDSNIFDGGRSAGREGAPPAAAAGCPGRPPACGGRVRQPLAAEAAAARLDSVPLSEEVYVQHLLLSVAQAVDTLECATLAPRGPSGRSVYYTVRQQAVKKMRVLNVFLERKGALVDDKWLRTAETGLHRLHRHIGHLPEPAAAAAAIHDPTRAPAGHHLFHLHLETRLLSAAALARLSRLAARSPPEGPHGPPVPWLAGLPERDRWRRAVHALAWDLTALACSRMQQVPLSDLASTSAFSCGCEKGAWLALRRLLDSDGHLPVSGAEPADAYGQLTEPDRQLTEAGRSAELWQALDLVFDFIRTGRRDGAGGGEDDVFSLRDVHLTEKPIFLVWMLCNVGDVLRYDRSDTYQQNVQCAGNVRQLLSLLEWAAPAEGAEDEGRLACLLALCGRLTALWGPSAPLAARLWEVMARRLVQPQPPGPVSVSQMTHLLPRSGRAWWEAVARPAALPADSFGQYLRLLPAQLAGPAGADSWRQLRGRLLLRLHPRRAVALSAAGLAAVCSLFLTLLNTVSDPQLLEKFMSFLSLASESSTHQVLVCRAYFATIHLLLEAERDVAGAAQPAATQADRELRAAADGRPASLSLLAAYLDECAEAVRASPRLDKSEYLLLTAAWRGYLSSCGSAELARCLAVLLQLATKLLANIRQLQPMAHVVDTEVVTRSEQYSQLADRLRLVSPVVQALALSRSPPAELADLAATLTLIPGTGCEPDQFTADSVTPSVCASFVSHLLSSDPERLGCDADRLAHLWLRCLASAPERPELAPLTAAVGRRSPLVPAELAPGDRQLAPRFVERLARLAEQGLEGRERVNKVVGSLTFIEHCLRSARSSQTVSHLYHVFGLVTKKLVGVLEHRKIVYIVNRLLLPAAVYDSQKPLPPPVHAALSRWLPLFMLGISHTEYATHPFYRRCVKDTLVNYIYRFPDGSQPIVDLLKSDEAAVEFKEYVIRVMTEVFLQKTSVKFHPHLLQALQAILALLGDRDGGREVIVAQQMTTALLETLLSLEEPRAKRSATDLLRKVCESPEDAVRAALSAAVERLLERHLAFSSARVFRLLEVVAVLAPAVTRALLPSLEQHVCRTEIRRGVGEDRNLRFTAITRLDVRCWRSRSLALNHVFPIFRS